MINENIVKQALLKCSTPILHDYFFNNLSSSEWINPLMKARPRIFKSPPKEQGSGDQRTYYPMWPESRYLARIADQAPDSIVKIIIELEETSNYHVHEDFADAILKIPVKHINNKVVEKIIDWLSYDKQDKLPEKAAAIALKLAANKDCSRAVNIMKFVLAINVEPDKPFRLSANPRCYLYGYDSILHKYTPKFIVHCGTAVIELLEKTLKFYLDRGGSYSHIIRPSLEFEDRQSSDFVIDLIVDSIIYEYSKYLESFPYQIDHVIKRMLSDNEPEIINRIGLYILYQVDIRKIFNMDYIFLNQRYYVSHGLWNEFSKLLGARFSELSIDERTKALDIIGNINLYEVDSTSYGSDLSKYCCYKLIEPYLTDEHLEVFIKLKAKYDNNSYEINKNNWKSSYSSAQLMKFDLEKLYSISAEITELSLEDFSYELKTALIDDPKKAIDLYDLVSTLDPIFIRAIVSSLYDTSKELNWESVLSICSKVSQIPYTSTIVDKKNESDVRVNSAKKNVLLLIRKGIQSNLVPFSLREKIWSVIDLLINDNCYHFLDDQDETKDFYQLAINTVCSSALEVAIFYGLWIRKHIIGADKSSTFKSATELELLFNKCLDMNQKSAVLMWGVFGALLPWVQVLDANWLSAIKDTLFTKDKNHHILANSAWDAYMRYSQVYKSIFDEIKPEYEYKVNLLGTLDKDMHIKPNDTAHRLAEHVMALYMYGALGDNPGNNMVSDFLNEAPYNIIKHAVSYIGLVLINDKKNNIDDNSLNRLKLLWKALKAKFNGKFSYVLEPFSFWFASSKFDKDWSITELLSLLQDSNCVRVDYRICEALDSYTNSHRLQLLEVMKNIVINIRKYPDFISAKTYLGDILNEMKDNLQPNETEAFISVINELAKNGYTEFRVLLNSIKH